MGKAPEDRLVGKVFEKCRIIGKLGTGGMGSVWMAEHFGLGRKVAVKILPPDMGRDPEYVARFMREATTAGRMEHPNIVQIHDVGYAEGRHFLVMQYVDGESLSTVVDTLGAMDPRDAAKVAAGILRGLQHAHEQGIVHRDVKPDNVLITKGDQPMLLDFGLAIETETALQITKDGMVVGTPYYLSPEQARGQKATPLSDQYAAGVTLYYLLTGKRPFVGATALAVLNKHIHEMAVPPVKIRPAIPQALSDIVLKMMAKRPEDRYPHAGAASADLEAFLAGKAVNARIPFRLPSLRTFPTWPRKHQMIAVGGAAGFLLVLGVLLFSLFSGGGEPARPTAVVIPRNPPPSEPTENPDLRGALEFEKENRDILQAYAEVVRKYEVLIGGTTSEPVALKARKALDAFLEHVSRRAQEKFEQVLREPDPVKRLQQFESFPKPFRDYTPIDTRIREERPRILEQIEARYAENERKLAAAMDGGDYSQVRTLIDDMLRGAEGARRVRLEKLRGDSMKLEEEYKNEILRKLTRAYGPVHDAFEKALIARENAQAYTKVTAFLKGITDDAEKNVARVPKTNYDTLLALVPDNVLPDSRLGTVRLLMLSAFAEARDTLPYRILTDLQDALDVEFLIRAAGQWVRDPASAKRELPLEGLGHGRVTLAGAQGILFYPKAGTPKPVQIRQLHPRDLLLMAGALEDKTAEQIYESNELLCRAAGVAYLHSTVTDRWAQASRWLQRAHELNVRGIAFRLDGIRERGYREVRDRVTQARAEAAQRKIEPAKRRLAEIAPAWAHEPALKEEIDRALAAILFQELRQLEGSPDSARIKQLARTLRESHAGQYDEETVLRIYATVARTTGFWHVLPTALKDETWTWPGKAEGSVPPASDESAANRGIRLKGGQSVGLHASKLKGAIGFNAQIAVVDATRPFAAGIRFDTSDTDPRYRRLVIHNTEVALYRGDGTREERIARAPLPKKIASGEWVDLTYAVEGNDLICYFDKREVFIVSGAPAPDRGIALISTGDASFRSLTLRK